MSYIESLQAAIKRLHGCEAKHLESIPVHETFKGQTVWDGNVEVFLITGHPKAKKCYAWSHAEEEDEKNTKFITVLELPPVSSPETAVKAAIVSESKK